MDSGTETRKRRSSPTLNRYAAYDRVFAISLLIPAFAIVIVVLIVPLFDAVRMSFTRISLLSINVEKYVGLRNYINLFKDSSYWQVVGNTFLIVAISVLLSLVIGLALALALNAMTRGRGAMRGLFIVPWLIPGVVIGITWRWLLGTQNGIINYIVHIVGLSRTNLPWLADTFLSPLAVNLVFIWSSVPFMMVTCLAGLQTVPEELLEVSTIDGASYWQQLRFVILPLLVPILEVATILRIVYTMQNFVIIFMLTGGGPGYSTETFTLYVYDTAFNSSQLGKASAIGTTWFIFLLIFIVVYFRLISRESER